MGFRLRFRIACRGRQSKVSHSNDDKYAAFLSDVGVCVCVFLRGENCHSLIRPSYVCVCLYIVCILTCSRACGAISTTTALSGTRLRPSWKRTGLTRLLQWYSAEEYRASGLSQSFWGIDVLIHLADLCFGSLITYKGGGERESENGVHLADDLKLDDFLVYRNFSVPEGSLNSPPEMTVKTPNRLTHIVLPS